MSNTQGSSVFNLETIRAKAKAIKAKSPYLGLSVFGMSLPLLAMEPTAGFIVLGTAFLIDSPNEMQKKYKDFANTLAHKLFDGNYAESKIDQKAWLKALDDGRWCRLMVLGISDKEMGWLIKNPLDNAGVLLVGGMGSGKSTCGKFILTTMFASAKGKAVFLFCDVSSKGCADYSPFFKFKGCTANALYDPAKLIPLFLFLDDELKKRQTAFANMFASENMTAYEKNYETLQKLYNEMLEALKSGKDIESIGGKFAYKCNLNSAREVLEETHKHNLLDMPRERLEALKGVLDGDTSLVKKALHKDKFEGVAQVNVLIEEFHSVPNSPEMNFQENQDIQGTIANILKNLAKVSRSFGFNFILVNQRATFTEVPPNIKLIANTTLCHKVNNPSDASGLNLSRVEEIKGEEMKGRAVYEEGFSQAPFLSKDTMDTILEKYYVPLKAKLFGKQLGEYQTAFQSEGSDGMADVMTHEFVVLNNTMFRPKKIIEKFFKAYGWNIDESYKTTATEIQIVLSKEDKKIGVIVNQNRETGAGKMAMSNGPSEKKMKDFANECDMLGIQGKLFINLDKREGGMGGSRGMMNGGSSDLVEKITYEDLLKAGVVFDNKETTVEEGNYEDLYKNLALTKFLNTVENPVVEELGSDDQQHGDDDIAIRALPRRRNRIV